MEPLNSMTNFTWPRRPHKYKVTSKAKNVGSLLGLKKGLIRWGKTVISNGCLWNSNKDTQGRDILGEKTQRNMAG